jgi:hypothetical protein
MIVFREEPEPRWAVIGIEAVDSMMAHFLAKYSLLLATNAHYE